MCIWSSNARRSGPGIDAAAGFDEPCVARRAARRSRRPRRRQRAQAHQQRLRHNVDVGDRGTSRSPRKRHRVHFGLPHMPPHPLDVVAASPWLAAVQNQVQSAALRPARVVDAKTHEPLPRRLQWVRHQQDGIRVDWRRYSLQMGRSRSDYLDPLSRRSLQPAQGPRHSVGNVSRTAPGRDAAHKDGGLVGRCPAARRPNDKWDVVRKKRVANGHGVPRLDAATRFSGRCGNQRRRNRTRHSLPQQRTSSNALNRTFDLPPPADNVPRSGETPAASGFSPIACPPLPPSPRRGVTACERAVTSPPASPVPPHSRRRASS